MHISSTPGSIHITSVHTAATPCQRRQTVGIFGDLTLECHSAGIALLHQRWWWEI